MSAPALQVVAAPPIPGMLRVFEMWRGNDESETSGTGKVGEGVEFSDGAIAFRWLTNVARSFVLYSSFADFHAVHIGQHPTNETILRVLWPPVEEQGA